VISGRERDDDGSQEKGDSNKEGKPSDVWRSPTFRGAAVDLNLCARMVRRVLFLGEKTKRAEGEGAPHLLGQLYRKSRKQRETSVKDIGGKGRGIPEERRGTLALERQDSEGGRTLLGKIEGVHH